MEPYLISRNSRRQPRWRRAIAVALLFLSTVVVEAPNGRAQETPQLPAKPGSIGPIKRDADGRIVPAAPVSEVPVPAPPRPTSAPTPPATAAPQARPGVPRPANAAEPAAPAAKPSDAAPTVQPTPARTASTPRIACPTGSIACFSVDGTGPAEQSAVPVTVGLGFARGALAGDGRVVARDGRGRELPAQIDQTSRHADGSVRFGIVSVRIETLAAQERSIVGIYPASGAGASGSNLSVAEIAARGIDAAVELSVYSPQISVVRFGNRETSVAGIPFNAGDTVTIELGGHADERYAFTVTQPLAGGGVTTLRELSRAFLPLINGRSKRYRAYKTDEAYGDENIWITAREGVGEPFDVVTTTSGGARMRTYKVQEWERPVRYAVSTRKLLESAAREAAPATWLAGPVTTEIILESPFIATESGMSHPHLTARVYLRAFAHNPAVRIDAVIENDWAYEPGPRNWTYDITFRGDKVETRSGVIHYHHARWHKVFWVGKEPLIHAAPEMSSFVASGLLPAYDQNVPVGASVLADLASTIAKSDTGPMGNGLLVRYMPTTGGRSDIGFLPRWSALHVLTLDPRAAHADIVHGDVAGGVPIHYRDRKTGQPVSLDDHPRMTMANGKPGPGDAFPPITNGATDWTADISHQPSLAYMPYLVSGNLFYLEEMMYWANWNMARSDPDYRELNRGIMYEQVRGIAWGLRSLGHLAAVLPDRHPMRRYFVEKLTNNIDHYLRTRVRNTDRTAATALGFLESDRNSVAPWQNDFLVVVVGYLKGIDVAGASEFLDWLGRFAVGRWTKETEGYCVAMATPYYIRVRDKSGVFYDKWGDVMADNWPDAKTCPEKLVGGDPDAPAGYVAYAAAALATAANHGVAKAGDAYQVLLSRAPKLKAGYSQDPTWAIVPRAEAGRRGS